MAIPTIDRSRLRRELDHLIDRLEFDNLQDATEKNEMFHVKPPRKSAPRDIRLLVKGKIQRADKFYNENIEHWEACASCGVENRLVRSGKLWLQPNHNCNGNKLAQARH